MVKIAIWLDDVLDYIIDWFERETKWMVKR